MKIGDYIRTDEGIRKIIREYDIYYELDRSLHYMYPEGHDLNKEDVDDIVLKSSPNIIDLIDYEDVVKIIYDGKEFICKVVNVLGTKGVQINLNYSISLNATKIKSIVTKEQFSSMEYKIGDE